MLRDRQKRLLCEDEDEIGERADPYYWLLCLNDRRSDAEMPGSRCVVPPSRRSLVGRGASDLVAGDLYEEEEGTDKGHGGNETVCTDEKESSVMPLGRGRGEFKYM